MRVVCSIPNASRNISGIPFAPAEVEGERGTCMVSADITEDRAAALLRVDGFRRLPDGATDLKALDAELNRPRAGTPVDQAGRRIRELQAANQALGAELRECQAALEKARQELEELRAEQPAPPPAPRRRGPGRPRKQSSPVSPQTDNGGEGD